MSTSRETLPRRSQSSSAVAVLGAGRGLALVLRALRGENLVLTDLGRQAVAKMNEIRQYPQVSVSYASADDHRYVSLSGRASLIQDAEKSQHVLPARAPFR